MNFFKDYDSYQVDLTDSNVIRVQVTATGAGRSEIEALAHIIADLQVSLQAKVMSHALETTLHPVRCAADIAPEV